MTKTLLTVAFCLSFTLVCAQRIVIYLDNAPNSTPSVSKAILRYDKDFAYSLTFDDGAVNAYTYALPLLQGGFLAGNSTTYTGLFATDGCGNNLPFRAGISWNAANVLGIDNHTGNVPNMMTWTQLDDLYDKGWDVFNHSLTHRARILSAMTTNDYIYEINQNLIETRNKTRNRIEMSAFVVPSGDTDYQNNAYQQGQKIVFDQSPNTIGIGGLSVANNINFNGQTVHRTEIDNEINSGGNQIGTVANRTAAGERIWYNEFTHNIDNQGASGGLNFYSFKNHVERIANNWGKNGTDRMWMAPLQEVFEYVTTRQTATYTTTLNGNQLIIDFNLQNVPTGLRRRPLTLVVNSNATFSRVDVPQGVKMTFNGTGAKKIINLDLAGASTVVSNPCDNDVTPPILANCPQNINLTTTGTSVVANWTPPIVTDNCAATPSVSRTYASGATFPIGTMPVTYTATDARGNSSTCTFNVTVTQIPTNPCLTDATPPVLRNCPTNIILTTVGTNAVATWTPPTATDNCTVTPTISSNYPSGQTFAIGSTTVTYAATDARGNRTTCSFTVSVQAINLGDCTSKSDTPWAEWVSKVQFNTLINNSEKTRNDRFVVGYSDWRDKSTTLIRGRIYPLSITASESYSVGNTMLYYRAWIDYNGNNVFETSEKVLELSNNGRVVATQSVKIPTNTVFGTVKMRISMKKGSYATPCENFAYGEVEDYSVVLVGTNSAQVSLVQERPTQLVPVVIQRISPNPTRSDIFVKLESLDARKVEFQFYDAVGTRVKSVVRSLEKGMNTVGFDFSDAPQGVYFIQTDVGKGQEVPTKFIKM